MVHGRSTQKRRGPEGRVGGDPFRLVHRFRRASRYFSYADRLTIHRILRGSAFAATQPLFVLEGGNDGWVSFRSAPWRGFRGTIGADHGEEIGYDRSPAGGLPFGVLSHPFDHFALYARIVNEIAPLEECEPAGRRASGWKAPTSWRARGGRDAISQCRTSQLRS